MMMDFTQGFPVCLVKYIVIEKTGPNSTEVFSHPFQKHGWKDTKEKAKGDT